MARAVTLKRMIRRNPARYKRAGVSMRRAKRFFLILSKR
jgi:hypothetical protein